MSAVIARYSAGGRYLGSRQGAAMKALRDGPKTAAQLCAALDATNDAVTSRIMPGLIQKGFVRHADGVYARIKGGGACGN